MSRWNPDARGRLQQAAYELVRERGYEQTTVADIAARAGLTERTFFRHYADKREVLFGGAELFQSAMTAALADAPPTLSAIAGARAAVDALSGLMHGRRDDVRERQRIIDTHADLQERGLIKRATLTAALARLLEERGIAGPAARYAAEIGMTVFYVAFAQWIDETGDRELLAVIDEGFARLKAVASGA